MPIDAHSTAQISSQPGGRYWPRKGVAIESDLTSEKHRRNSRRMPTVASCPGRLTANLPALGAPRAGFRAIAAASPDATTLAVSGLPYRSAGHAIGGRVGLTEACE